MLNRIIVMGRLTRDPELRRTQNGISVTSFSVAVERDFKSQNGERETDFIDVVAWRNTAEFVTRYFTKGRMAVVDGRLQLRDWTDREGQRRRSAEIVADNVYFGDSKRDNNGGDFGNPPPYGAPASGGYGAPSGGYGGSAGYGSAPTQSAPGYGAAPAGPAAQSDFEELGEEDGDLPF